MAIVKEIFRKVTADNETLRLYFSVEECKDEYDAIASTLADDGLIVPLSLPLDVTTQRNVRWMRWKVGLEEVYKGDTDRTVSQASPIGVYHTVMEYKTRATCPRVEMNWGMSSIRVYEGIDSQSHMKWRNGVTQSSGLGNAVRIGIQQERQSGSLSVRGTQKSVPEGRFTVVWHPWLQNEALEASYINYANMSPSTWQTSDYINTQQYIETTHRLVTRVHGPRATNTTTGEVDWNTFIGKFPGEVQLQGFTASKIDERMGLYEFRYEFGYYQNPGGRTVTIDGISLDDTEGWDHLWGERGTDKNIVVQAGDTVPYSRYMFLRRERLYERYDMNMLFHDSGSDPKTNMVYGCPHFEHLPPASTTALTDPDP